MTLEQACGLHERVSFLYVVDGYLCSLTDHEGMRELFTAKGETMQEALDGLRELVRPYASKKEMKLAAQIRIEAEAIGARVWQAGREVSFLPKTQGECRAHRGPVVVDCQPMSDEEISETLKRKKEHVGSQQASKRVAQGIEPLFQEEHTRRVKELEAVQEKLMADVEEAIDWDECFPDHVTHD